MKVKAMVLKAFNALLIFLNFSLAIFTLLISYGVSLTFGLSITVLVLVIFGIVVLYCFCLWGIGYYGSKFRCKV